MWGILAGTSISSLETEQHYKRKERKIKSEGSSNSLDESQIVLQE